jgi:hypothetical protein
MLVTLDLANTLLDLLVDHAYVQGFDMLWQQVGGIPLGVSPGVYSANFYLFTDEFKFLEQLVNIIDQHPPDRGLQDEVGLEYLDPAIHQNPVPGLHVHLPGHLARLVWKSFKFTIRYVDDLESIANKYLDQLLY